jgi:hypothetical protein
MDVLDVDVLGMEGQVVTFPLLVNSSGVAPSFLAIMYAVLYDLISCRSAVRLLPLLSEIEALVALFGGFVVLIPVDVSLSCTHATPSRCIVLLSHYTRVGGETCAACFTHIYAL